MISFLAFSALKLCGMKRREEGERERGGDTLQAEEPWTSKAFHALTRLFGLNGDVKVSSQVILARCSPVVKFQLAALQLDQ